ncbi:hypothetical protein BLNAU_19093 [Blattamonas nauphoetae]|uniref:Uncharacterized protein n=1 Tax=Blattamonas nauphoetae TaxID=2049346 RepID=A0ABQ9X2F3_9EUKA|nr:hypothetical protein BLNAU_19093 [Blattamonas nauphoetae]
MDVTRLLSAIHMSRKKNVLKDGYGPLHDVVDRMGEDEEVTLKNDKVVRDIFFLLKGASTNTEVSDLLTLFRKILCSKTVLETIYGPKNKEITYTCILCHPSSTLLTQGVQAIFNIIETGFVVASSQHRIIELERSRKNHFFAAGGFDHVMELILRRCENPSDEMLVSLCLGIFVSAYCTRTISTDFSLMISLSSLLEKHSVLLLNLTKPPLPPKPEPGKDEPVTLENDFFMSMYTTRIEALTILRHILLFSTAQSILKIQSTALWSGALTWILYGACSAPIPIKTPNNRQVEDLENMLAAMSADANIRSSSAALHLRDCYRDLFFLLCSPSAVSDILRNIFPKALIESSLLPTGVHPSQTHRLSLFRPELSTDEGLKAKLQGDWKYSLQPLQLAHPLLTSATHPFTSKNPLSFPPSFPLLHPVNLIDHNLDPFLEAGSTSTAHLTWHEPNYLLSPFVLRWDSVWGMFSLPGPNSEPRILGSEDKWTLKEKKEIEREKECGIHSLINYAETLETMTRLISDSSREVRRKRTKREMDEERDKRPQNQTQSQPKNLITSISLDGSGRDVADCSYLLDWEEVLRTKRKETDDKDKRTRRSETPIGLARLINERRMRNEYNGKTVQNKIHESLKKKNQDLPYSYLEPRPGADSDPKREPLASHAEQDEAQLLGLVDKNGRHLIQPLKSLLETPVQSTQTEESSFGHSTELQVGQRSEPFADQIYSSPLSKGSPSSSPTTQNEPSSFTPVPFLPINAGAFWALFDSDICSPVLVWGENDRREIPRRLLLAIYEFQERCAKLGRDWVEKNKSYNPFLAQLLRSVFPNHSNSSTVFSESSQPCILLSSQLASSTLQNQLPSTLFPPVSASFTSTLLHPPLDLFRPSAAFHSINTNLSSAVSHFLFKSFYLDSLLVEFEPVLWMNRIEAVSSQMNADWRLARYNLFTLQKSEGLFLSLIVETHRLLAKAGQEEIDRLKKSSEGESNGRASTLGSLNVILRLLRCMSLLFPSTRTAMGDMPFSELIEFSQTVLRTIGKSEIVLARQCTHLLGDSLFLLCVHLNHNSFQLPDSLSPSLLLSLFTILPHLIALFPHHNIPQRISRRFSSPTYTPSVVNSSLTVPISLSSARLILSNLGYILSLFAVHPSFPLSIGKHAIDLPQERVERKKKAEANPKQLDAFEESLFVPFASDTLDTMSDSTKLDHVRRIIRKRISDLPSSLELNPLFSEIERQVESELLVFLQNKIDRKKHKSKIERMMASDQTNKLHRRLGGDDSTRPTSAAVPTHLPQQPRFQIRTGNIDNSPSLVKPSQIAKEQSQQSTPTLQRGGSSSLLPSPFQSKTPEAEKTPLVNNIACLCERCQRLSEIEAEEEEDIRDVLTMLDTAEKMLRECSPLTHPKVLKMTQNTLDQTSFFEFNLDFNGNVQTDDTPAPTHALPARRSIVNSLPTSSSPHFGSTDPGQGLGSPMSPTNESLWSDGDSLRLGGDTISSSQSISDLVYETVLYPQFGRGRFRIGQTPCVLYYQKSGRGSEFGGAHGNGRGGHLMSLFSLFPLSVKEEDVQTEKADNKPTGRTTHSFEPTGRRTMETEDPDADEIVMFLVEILEGMLKAHGPTEDPLFNPHTVTNPPPVKDTLHFISRLLPSSSDAIRSGVSRLLLHILEHHSIITSDLEASDLVEDSGLSLFLLKSLANGMTLETACLMAYCIVLNLKAMWLQSTETKNTDSVQKKKVEEELEEESLAFTTVKMLLDEKGTPLKEDPERVAQAKLAQTKPCPISFFESGQRISIQQTLSVSFASFISMAATLLDDISFDPFISMPRTKSVLLLCLPPSLVGALFVCKNTSHNSPSYNATPFHTLTPPPPLLPSTLSSPILSRSSHPLLLFCTQFNHTRSHLSKVEVDTRAFWTADTQNTLTLFLNRVFSNYTERMSQTQLVPFVSFQKDFERALKSLYTMDCTLPVHIAFKVSNGQINLEDQPAVIPSFTPLFPSLPIPNPPFCVLPFDTHFSSDVVFNASFSLLPIAQFFSSLARDSLLSAALPPTPIFLPFTLPFSTNSEHSTLLPSLPKWPPLHPPSALAVPAASLNHAFESSLPHFMFLRQTACPLGAVLSSDALSTLTAQSNLMSLACSLSALFEQIVLNDDLTFPIRPFIEMDDSSPLLNFLPSSKIPLACSILHAFVLLLISNPSLPHSAYFDTHRCALFTVEFCIDTLSSVITQFEARLTLAASAALPLLLFPLLLFLNSLLSSSLLPHPTPISSSSILNPNPQLKTKASSLYNFTHALADFVEGDGIIVLHRAVSVILLPQLAMILNHINSPIADALTFSHLHLSSLSGSFVSSLSILLFSNHHLTHPTKASGNVSSIAQKFEGDREEKRSRPFQPKFAQMPLIRRVGPKTENTNGSSDPSQMSSLRSIKSVGTLPAHRPTEPLLLITELVQQSLTLLLPFIVSVFVEEAKNSVFKPENEGAASMPIIQACFASLPSTTALTDTPESDVGYRQFGFTLLHYLLAFVLAIISDHARVKTSSSSSPTHADQSHNALSHLCSSFITSQAIIPSLLFLALFCPASLPVPIQPPLPNLPSNFDLIPKQTSDFFNHLSRLYALPSPSLITYNATKILSQLQKIKKDCLEKAFSSLDLDLEEVRDLALPEAFHPTLSTTIADQIRDSPQIWYGFRAGLNEKSIHIWKYGQSDHVVCRLIVDEKTLDCLVIEAKESGHLAELTGYDSSSESLSHLNKVAQWKRKKIGEDDTPTKAGAAMVEPPAILSMDNATLREAARKREEARLLCVNADLMEQVANGQISKSIIMSDESNTVWDEAVQRQTFLDLNAAVSYAGQHTKIFRTCYSFFEQNRHSAVADRKDKTDEPQVKGREELGVVQILDERVKEALHVEIVKLREWELEPYKPKKETKKKKKKRATLGGKRADLDREKEEIRKGLSKESD